MFILSLNVKQLFWPIDRTLLSAATPGHSGLGSNGNEGVLHILQSYNITGTSPSDYCLRSYPGCLLGGESYHSAETQSVFSTAPANRAVNLFSINIKAELQIMYLCLLCLINLKFCSDFKLFDFEIHNHEKPNLTSWASLENVKWKKKNNKVPD